ncbi:polyhydroxyalkanoic acid inclusion protein PhaP [Microbacteriaceae bacterium 4G12]
METKSYELVDAFWKNWFQSISTLSSTGKQMEQLTLETLKQQQDSLHKMAEGMETMEQEMKQHFSQLNSQYTDYMKQIAGNQVASQMEEWQEKWNELSQQMQQYSLSPTKTSLSLLSQASGQFEETIKQLISQNQQQREDIQKQLENFSQDIKTMQLDLVQKFEDGTKNLFTSMK